MTRSTFIDHLADSGRLALRLAVLAIVIVPVLACCSTRLSSATDPKTADTNSIAAFLDGAELQAENTAQRLTVRAVLADMLRVSGRELRALRFANDEGVPGQWTAIQVLTAHFVPRSPRALDDATFYEECDTPPARRAAGAWLEKLQSAAE